MFEGLWAINCSCDLVIIFTKASVARLEFKFSLCISRGGGLVIRGVIASGWRMNGLQEVRRGFRV